MHEASRRPLILLKILDYDHSSNLSTSGARD
jgi:hypothetical protein